MKNISRYLYLAMVALTLLSTIITSNVSNIQLMGLIILATEYVVEEIRNK